MGWLKESINTRIRKAMFRRWMDKHVILEYETGNNRGVIIKADQTVKLKRQYLPAIIISRLRPK